MRGHLWWYHSWMRGMHHHMHRGWRRRWRHPESGHRRRHHSGMWRHHHRHRRLCWLRWWSRDRYLLAFLDVCEIERCRSAHGRPALPRLRLLLCHHLKKLIGGRWRCLRLRWWWRRRWKVIHCGRWRHRRFLGGRCRSNAQK